MIYENLKFNSMVIGNYLKMTISYTCCILICSGLWGFQMMQSVEKPVKYDRASDDHTFTVFLENGGWCWYQDPRALIQENQLFIGAVEGNQSGAAIAGTFDLKRKKITRRTILQDDFDQDDHNAPVFYPRADGRILTVYALHNKDKRHFYRMTTNRRNKNWGGRTSICA